MSPSDLSPWQPPNPDATPPPPPPPSRPAAPPPPPGPYGGPVGYPSATYGVPQPVLVTPGKPPRPATRAAGALMLVGSVVIAVGSALPWISFGGTDYNAYDEWVIGFYFRENPAGPVFALFAAVLFGFGIATLAAGRVLPIMIIGIVLAAFALMAALVQVADYSDVTDETPATLGVGGFVTAIGAAAALAGAIAGCAKRRR